MKKTSSISRLIIFSIFTGLLSLLFVSCSISIELPQEIIDPYHIRYYYLKGDVEQVREIDYETNIESLSSVTGIKMATRDYGFGANHKIAFCIDSTFNKKSADSVAISFKNFQYTRNEKIRNITSSKGGEYKPTFDSKLKYMSGELFTYPNVVNNNQDRYYINLEYSRRGILTKKTETLNYNENIITTYYLYNNDTLLYETITTDKARNLKITSKYDEAGKITIEEIAEGDYNSSKIMSSYTYTYDNIDKAGNWLLRTKYNNKKQVVGFTQRQIVYFGDTNDDKFIVSTSISSDSFEGYINNIRYRMSSENQLKGTPSVTLTIVVLCVTLLVFGFSVHKPGVIFRFFRGVIGIINTIFITISGYSFYQRNFRFFFKSSNDYLSELSQKTNRLFKSFWGKIVKKTGMKRIWVYNIEPYWKTGLILIIAIISFVATLICMLLVGATIWGLFWVIHILLVFLIAVGWITLIGGGIVIFGGEENIFWGIVAVIIGGIIVGARRSIEFAGNRLVDNGFDFLRMLNLSQWSVNLFTNFWDLLLLIFLLPVVIFLIIALVIILFNGLLIFSEWMITMIYSINHPCPVCGSKAQPQYIVKNNSDKRYPVALRPSVYGMFHHILEDGTKVSTMLLNGRWKYRWRCQKCDKIINPMDKNQGITGYGTDIHFGFVGHKASGKTHLLRYGLVLIKNQIKNFVQTDMVQGSENNDELDVMMRRGIGGTNRTNYRALQFFFKSKSRKIPYHLFFYDVAGEQFNINDTDSHEAVRFYKNVNSFVFLIDPVMINYTGSDADFDFLKWVNDYKRKNSSENGNYNPEDTLSSLRNMLINVGRKTNTVDLNIVCVKMDRANNNWDCHKYFIQNKGGCSDIETFICKTMGLENVVFTAKSSFKSVRFYAVSATSRNTDSLQKLFKDMLFQQGVDI